MTGGRTFVRRRGYQALPNATVYDERLSYPALGLLLVLLSRPDNAPKGYRALHGRGLGETATRNALRELDAAGYRHQVKQSAARGRIVVDTVVSEEPITRDQAEQWLHGEALAVPWNPPHGATSANGASSQVGPRRASPQRGGPRHGQAQHVLRTQGDLETSSQVTEDPNGCEHGRARWQRCPECPDDVLCEHGTPRRYSACLECRPARRTRPAPTLDHAQRAAGEHLENAQ